MNTKQSIRLASKNFFQTIAEKHKAFATHKPLCVFWKRISAFIGRINFVYVFPLLIIRKNVLPSEKTRIATPIRKVWNILHIQFKYTFPSTRYLASTFNTSPQMTFAPSGESLPLEASKPYTFFNINYPIKIASEKQIGWLVEKTLLHGSRMISTHLLKVVNAELSVLKPFAWRRIPQRRPITSLHKKGLGADKGSEPLILDMHRKTKHAYPLIEYVMRTSPTVVTETREKVVEKEVVSEPRGKVSVLDVNRLADQIYQLIERRVRIERERRGL